MSEDWKKSLPLGDDEVDFKITTLSAMECLLMTAHESELGAFGGQIKIGTVVQQRPKDINVEVTFAGLPAIRLRSLEHALFQARKWREYAQTFDGRRTAGINADWVKKVLGMSRRDCLHRAHVWLMAAREWNEQAAAIKRKRSRWVNVAGLLAIPERIEGPEVVQEPWRSLPSSLEFEVRWEPTAEGKKVVESFSVRPKVGTRVRFMTTEKEYAGVVTAINPDGSLNLKISSKGEGS